MAEYASRETAAIAAADTEYDVNTLGHLAAQAITVPQGVTRISKVLTALASDGAATGAAVFWITLSGNGLLSEVTLMVGGVGGTLATSDIQTENQGVVDVDIPVKAGNQINIVAECNVDTGTASLGVTLEFR